MFDVKHHASPGTGEGIHAAEIGLLAISIDLVIALSRLMHRQPVVIPVIHEDQMIAVRLDPSTDERLTRLASETGRSKTYYVKQAIDAFLEDREDYLLALSVLERDEPRKPIAEVRRALGLDD
jgi:RHH-type rel operon transcriptional repressor/antitoxin RelB